MSSHPISDEIELNPKFPKQINLTSTKQVKPRHAAEMVDRSNAYLVKK